MATKLISASKILEAKGFKQEKFDTAGFTALVGQFFETHDVKDTLVLLGKRFLDMENPPKGGYADYTDETLWQRRCEDPGDPFDLFDYIAARDKGFIRPMVLVDEPFLKNAAFTLSVMCGFAVKKIRGGRYLVSLV